LKSKCMCCGKITKINDEPSELLSHGICRDTICIQALEEWSMLAEDENVSLDAYYQEKKR